MARKIEALMNEAIIEALNWKHRNTEVRTSDKVSHVYLHGNLIARVGEDFIQLFDGGWRSKTTKSRLSAILNAHGGIDSIFQKDFQWYVTTDGGTVPFTNGMILS